MLMYMGNNDVDDNDGDEESCDYVAAADDNSCC